MANAEPPDSSVPVKTFPVLSPEDEAKTFQLPAGYHVEAVLTDPEIKEPVVCVFDGNGRMYVGEMRTYMQDVDASNEMTLVNRVSRHESSKGDGVFDKHTIFADKLLPPREILPLLDRVLINETNTNDIFAYSDTGHDGVADKKELFYQGGPRGGNLEHQPSGLVWGLDNWIYQAVSNLRLRYTDGILEKGSTPGNGGQWGLSQDDYGKMWFVNAGGELGPLKYQTPIIYGGFDIPNDRSKDFQEVWPLVGLADVQGGYDRFRKEDNTLNHLTACAGIAVYRGDRLPPDMRGDVFINEPVGRLIRRAKVENKDGITYLRNAYDKSEFLRSTDPNFRPVNITTGPDGCLYIVDMYRGIIQQAAWVNKGSYLRKVVDRYAMDRITNHGRIWRLVHDGYTPGPAPHMLDETPAQLVAHLDHPNGWWRDQAQMLLVLHGDKSVVPALVEMARTNANPLARIHAIWTLDGLGALDAGLVREKLKDADPQVRIAAIRASERLVQKGDGSLIADLKPMAKDKDPNVVLQTLLTGKLLKWPEYPTFAATTLLGSSSDGVKQLGALALNDGSHGIDERHFSKADVATLHKGEKIYQELCFACHGFDGNGMPMTGAGIAPGTTQAPPLADARVVIQHRDAIIKILLNGLTGPVNDKQYLAQMVPMDTNADQWIAAVGSYVRNSFGNHGGMIYPADVARLRPQGKLRGKPWTMAQLLKSFPQPVGDPKEWKMTASVNPGAVRLCVDGDLNTRWSSNRDLAPGMWVQVEFPQPTAIGGILLDASKSPGDYPREYEIQTSDDGTTWSKPVAQGKGSPGAIEITFPAVTARFLRITQTGKLDAPGLYWSIHELEIFRPARD